MASEYHKWVARNEKPAEKKELTKEEKWKNWWYYHKWHVVIAAAAVLLVVFMVADVLTNLQSEPDYQLAYVGYSSLPEDTVRALQDALAAMGEDLNGNGKVNVVVNQYVFSEEALAYESNQAAQIQLMVDATNCTSFIFLMEKPEEFQKSFELLAYPDGTEPPMNAQPDEGLWYAWTDCPVLTGLELGGYSKVVVQETVTGENQQLLSGLYIARRIAPMNGFDTMEANVAFWEKLTAGAVK